MPKKPERSPLDAPHTLKVVPLEATQEAEAPIKRAGRPRKEEAALPHISFKMEEIERRRFEAFISRLRKDNPDLSGFDEIFVELAGLEYIKYLRVVGKELEDGEVISMARQHPSSLLLGLIDRLNATRRARQKNQPEADPQAETREKLRELFG